MGLTIDDMMDQAREEALRDMERNPKKESSLEIAKESTVLLEL